MLGIRIAPGPRRACAKLLLGFCFCTAVGLFFSLGGAQGVSLNRLSSALPRWYAWGALAPFIIWADRRILPPPSPACRPPFYPPARLLSTSVFAGIYSAHINRPAASASLS